MSTTTPHPAERAAAEAAKDRLAQQQAEQRGEAFERSEIIRARKLHTGGR